jgi:2-dehydropantoate 2-reductase
MDETGQQRHDAGHDGNPWRPDVGGCRLARHARSDGAAQEALDTGADIGYRALPIFGLTPDDVRETNRLVEKLLDTLLEGFVLPHTKTTVLQDWMKGRHSEVDELNGLVVAERMRRGKSAPVNAAVIELAHRIERGEIRPGPNNLAILLELAKLSPGS